jgi:pyridoxal phosphate enzyme (YggS family)
MSIAPAVTRLARNLSTVRQNIASACRRSGRRPDEVLLVAVTKSVGPDLIRTLLALGVTDLGENRVQQLVQRAGLIGRAPGGLDASAPPGGGPPRWHMVGHLQRNKVKALLEHARIIHSLDSMRLAEEIEHQAARRECLVEALLEVNVSGEASKQGVSPAELRPLVERVRGSPHIRLRGLMTMAPLEADPQATRPHFARLRELLEELRTEGLVEADCRHLSMGMSNDYAVAVEEGATIVRIGSALFAGLGDLPEGCAADLSSRGTGGTGDSYPADRAAPE